MPDSLEAWLGPAVSRPLGGREYVQLAFFSWAPMAVAVWAVVASSAAAGASQTARPLLVRQIVDRGARLGIVAAVALGVAAPFGLVDHVELNRLLLAPFALVPLGLACAGLGFLVAVVTGSRRMTLLIVGVETALVFLMNVAAHADLGLGWLRHLSPFHYADVQSAFLEGVTIWHALVLLLAAAAQFGIGLTWRTHRAVRS